MNQIVRSFIRIREDADYHVRAFRAWRASERQDITPSDFLKAIIFIAGFTLDEIRKDDRGVVMTEARISLVRAVKQKFPKLSAAQIGLLFNRERSTISRTLRSELTEGRRCSKLSSIDVSRIRRQYSKGKMNSRMLAEKFGVSHGTVSAIIRGEIYKGAI